MIRMSDAALGVKVIKLETKEQLNIYANVTRQRLLRALSIAGEPLTAKDISGQLGISPSSVQHHIRKLLQLGVVAVDHIAMVNGIRATYYVPVQATVQIFSSDGHADVQRAVTMSLVNNVLTGFISSAEHRIEKGILFERMRDYGDVMTGFLHLSDDDRKELFSIIDAYLREHEAPRGGTSTWEYALILYDTSR